MSLNKTKHRKTSLRNNELLRLQPVLHIVLHYLNALDYLKVRDVISSDTFDAVKQCDLAILTKESDSKGSNRNSSSSSSSSSSNITSNNVITIPVFRSPSNISQFNKTKNIEFPWVKNTLLIKTTSIVDLCKEMQHCIIRSARGTFPWCTTMILQWRLFRMLSLQLLSYHAKKTTYINTRPIRMIKVATEATSHMLEEHIISNTSDWQGNDLMAILGCAWPSRHIIYLWDTVKSNEHLFSYVRNTASYTKILNYFNQIVSPPVELICYVAAMSFVIIKTPAEYLHGSPRHPELRDFFVANPLPLNDLKTAIICAVMAKFRLYGIGHYGRLNEDQRLTRMNNVLEELMQIVNGISEMRVKGQYKFNSLQYYVELEGGIYNFVLNLFNTISRGFDRSTFMLKPSRVKWNPKGDEELFGWSINCLFNGDPNRFVEEFKMPSEKIIAYLKKIND